jgi:hypothetical protein
MAATKKQPARETGAAGNDKQASADELAKHIAAVLNHPDTPDDIYNALGDAVGGLETPPGFSDSEEYVALYLRAHLEGFRARNDARSDTRATRLEQQGGNVHKPDGGKNDGD